MLGYLLVRLARAALTIALVLTFSFFILAATGDPAQLIMSAEAPPEAVAAFRKQWGLDAPLWKQYLGYAGNLAEGRLGRSMRDGRDAWVVVSERIPLTLAITVPALLINILIGVSAGVVAALYRNTFIDRLVMAFSVAGYTVPSFVLGLTLMLVFAVWLGWLPSAGADSWRHAILPTVTLGVGGAAALSRFTRSAMLETLGQPYVRTGLAKGMLWRSVVTSQALPNAAIPTLTVAGFMLGSVMAGAVVVESVFAWPGVGRLLVSAVANRDLMVVQAILLLVTVAMVSANLLVDLLAGAIDPRLRAGQTRGTLP